ncbi:hypothetical protein [Phytomonospora endophytica]|uniref:Uncharacterized protein n=1 Tax=Phytomonospora endophytica TaxID=714109 RepID=A0A841FQX5_9ACTN|nr:hypothetical protein [Phytomonospora endophytica]MBB6035952.1 hypothetical protein [Phytomonospora endophytica]GIG66858.1 hypothetical protein Pen01_31530 [Phytomonospora endophytica]
MKEQLGGYETRLLAELTEVVETRSASRSWFTMPKLAVGGVALAALAVTGGLTLPVFGGASERSPNNDVAVTAEPPVIEKPAGFSLAVSADDGSVTVTIDDITDDEGLEAALKEKGVASNVVVLDGVHSDCDWPAYEHPDPEPWFGGGHDGQGGATFTVRPAEFSDGVTLLVAVYHVVADDGTPIETPLVGIAMATEDPGDCVAID